MDKWTTKQSNSIICKRQERNYRNYQYSTAQGKQYTMLYNVSYKNIMWNCTLEILHMALNSVAGIYPDFWFSCGELFPGWWLSFNNWGTRHIFIIYNILFKCQSTCGFGGGENLFCSRSSCPIQDLNWLFHI